MVRMSNNVSIGERLIELRERAREKMEAAMKAGQMDEVIKYARIIKEADDAAQVGKLAVDRISAQLMPNQERPNHEVDSYLERPITSPDQLSRKARGKAARDRYLRELNAKGVHLTRLKGRTFQTSSGRRVGVAYASEIHANKWWMGLPDEQYEVVVLLCETNSGEALDFVLPPEFVSRVWAHLTKSNKQREWHVARSGPNYELEPSKNMGQINTYLSNLDPLR